MGGPQFRKALYSEFRPFGALPAGDPRYVDWSVERGSAQLIQMLANTIRLSDEPTCQLLGGHPGCGKTTELLKLVDELANSQTEPRYFVVYCKADDYIELSDVEYPDVLIAVVQQLSEASQERGVELAPGRLGRFVDEIKGVLGAPVEPKEVEAKGGPLAIKFDIKKNETRRRTPPRFQATRRCSLVSPCVFPVPATLD
jgi:hypothetical protein